MEQDQLDDGAKQHTSFVNLKIFATNRCCIWESKASDIKKKKIERLTIYGRIIKNN